MVGFDKDPEQWFGGDYEDESVARYQKLNEFEGLSEHHKSQLLRLMSRISESSFRRGFQHGFLASKDDELDEELVSEFRFSESLHDSPLMFKSPIVEGEIVCPTPVFRIPSSRRLLIEYPVLYSLGLIPMKRS